MSKYIIDRVTKDTKFITGYTPNTLFGKREAILGLSKNIDGKWNYHIGQDYNTPEGTYLYAPCDGEFLLTVRDGYGGGYGNYILFYMPHYNKTVHLAHLNDIAPLEGKKVKKGTYIGATGNTGVSSGAHLHLGIARGKKTNVNTGKYGDGTWEDPSAFFLIDNDDYYDVKPATPKMSAKEMAYHIMYENHKYGVYPERKTLLEKDGYNFSEVQKHIEALLYNEKPVVTPAPKPTVTKNKHGQNVKIGDKIQFSVLYNTDSLKGAKSYFPDTLYYREKRGDITVGYGYVTQIMENGYRVAGNQGGKTIGFVRPVNTY